jgi:uncharacterized protein YndB with AHSA1/START domain
MASNHVYIAAGPETVWEVLADAGSYAHWVVGSSQTRRVEGRWPARGALFHHTQGVGPIGLRDSTEVIDAKRPKRLVLEVRMRPLLVARVELSLAAHGEGTWLTIRESPFGGLAGRFAGPLLEPLLAFRNLESLRRLRRMAERRARAAA